MRFKAELETACDIKGFETGNDLKKNQKTA